MEIKTIDMRCIRYLNLFSKETQIKTKNCFFYNNQLIFAVPSLFVARAIGIEGKNVKKLASILKRKIKIVALPQGIRDAEKFISRIVFPLKFRRLEVFQNEIIISAERQNKALLIGRNKTRFFELQKIIREFFGKELRIV